VISFSQNKENRLKIENNRILEQIEVYKRRGKTDGGIRLKGSREEEGE
jgi:hypothetical protein